jgi:hypothetical protein
VVFLVALGRKSIQFSKAKIRFQSFFMLMTNQPSSRAKVWRRNSILNNLGLLEGRHCQPRAIAWPWCIRLPRIVECRVSLSPLGVFRLFVG